MTSSSSKSFNAHKTSVLLVCLGNICRSPTAQVVLMAKAASAGLDLDVDSAGTGGWHAGEPADKRAQIAGERRGYDFTGLTARAVESLDFARFDYVLAMDKKNLATLRELCPSDYSGHLSLFLDFAGKSNAEMPDPYYGGDDGFETVLDLCEAASSGLIAVLKTQ